MYFLQNPKRERSAALRSSDNVKKDRRLVGLSLTTIQHITKGNPHGKP